MKFKLQHYINPNRTEITEFEGTVKELNELMKIIIFKREKMKGGI